MKRSLSIALLVAVGATAVFAQSAAITQRREAMKAIAGAAKEPGGMAKGEVSFDLAKVHAFLKVCQEQSPKVKGLFPDDSKDGDTKALPVVWEKKSDFLSRFDKLAADCKAAENAIKDEASFKSEWPKVTGNCGGCHKEYRKS
jgi:cytochrome c556